MRPEVVRRAVDAAREGLLALSVGVGLGIVHEPMEPEVTEVVGPKGRHDRDRVAKRHEHEDGSMTLGGRRVPAPSSTSKSAVSDLFIARTRTALGELMGRRLDDVRLALMMLDALDVADRCHVVALGINSEGVKIALGLWEGSTEDATMLADLVDRRLDPEQAILFVIDGGKALRRAIRGGRCWTRASHSVCPVTSDRSASVADRMGRAGAQAARNSRRGIAPVGYEHAARPHLSG